MSIQPSTTQPSSPNWQLSLNTQGEVVTDADSLRQSVELILLTEPGRDVMRPEFGIGLLSMIGQPIQHVAAELNRRGKAQFKEYLPQVTVTGYKVTPSELDPGKITITVNWTVNGASASITVNV